MLASEKKEEKKRARNHANECHRLSCSNLMKFQRRRRNEPASKSPLEAGPSQQAANLNNSPPRPIARKRARAHASPRSSGAQWRTRTFFALSLPISIHLSARQTGATIRRILSATESLLLFLLLLLIRFRSRLAIKMSDAQRTWTNGATHGRTDGQRRCSTAGAQIGRHFCLQRRRLLFALYGHLSARRRSDGDTCLVQRPRGSSEITLLNWATEAARSRP